MTTSAHELMRTVDCSFPGCDREADDPRTGLCRDHWREANGNVPKAEDDDKRLQRMFANDQAPGRGDQVTMTKCKVEGCTIVSAGKGGSWHGLCTEHIRIEGSRRQQLARERRNGTAKTPQAVKPPPAANTPTKETTPAASTPRVPAPAKEQLVPDPSLPFAGLADRVVELEHQVAGLDEQLSVARRELGEAAAAFVRHLRDRYGVDE